MTEAQRNSTIVTDRVFTPGLAQVAYIVADTSTGEAAIIDPRRDVGEYVSWAEERGLRYIAIIETHVHADFVSGGKELAKATGATVYASRLGDVAYDHVPVDDGDVIHVGSVRLKALFTPGHTPEHMAFLLLPNPESDTPEALYSGDVLFVGDVGRPDLLGEEATKELSKQLHDTVVNRLKTLPDDVVVYPGHTAGSSCGKNIGDAPSTTIGQEKADNYAFQEDEQGAFVEQVLRDMPSPPTYYPQLKKVNTTGATLIENLPAPRAMTVAELRSAQQNGALLIDTRQYWDFGAKHIPGALFAGYGPNFHTWLGWVAPYDRDLVIVNDGSPVDDIVTALRQIGLDRIVGHLQGGMEAWDGETETLPQVDVRTLAETTDNYHVLDVRSADEWAAGHIEGAAHLPADEIARGEVPEAASGEKPIAVICGSGYRSSVSSSLLQASGVDNVVNVAGGMAAWNEAGLPVTR